MSQPNQDMVDILHCKENNEDGGVQTNSSKPNQNTESESLVTIIQDFDPFKEEKENFKRMLIQATYQVQTLWEFFSKEKFDFTPGLDIGLTLRKQLKAINDQYKKLSQFIQFSLFPAEAEVIASAYVKFRVEVLNQRERSAVPENSEERSEATTDVFSETSFLDNMKNYRRHQDPDKVPKKEDLENVSWEKIVPKGQHRKFLSPISSVLKILFIIFMIALSTSGYIASQRRSDGLIMDDITEALQISHFRIGAVMELPMTILVNFMRELGIYNDQNFPAWFPTLNDTMTEILYFHEIFEKTFYPDAESLNNGDLTPLEIDSKTRIYGRTSLKDSIEELNVKVKECERDMLNRFRICGELIKSSKRPFAEHHQEIDAQLLDPVIEYRDETQLYIKIFTILILGVFFFGFVFFYQMYEVARKKVYKMLETYSKIPKSELEDMITQCEIFVEDLEKGIFETRKQDKSGPILQFGKRSKKINPDEIDGKSPDKLVKMGNNKWVQLQVSSMLITLASVILLFKLDPSQVAYEGDRLRWALAEFNETLHYPLYSLEAMNAFDEAILLQFVGIKNNKLHAKKDVFVTQWELQQTEFHKLHQKNLQEVLHRLDYKETFDNIFFKNTCEELIFFDYSKKLCLDSMDGKIQEGGIYLADQQVVTYLKAMDAKFQQYEFDDAEWKEPFPLLNITENQKMNMHFSLWQSPEMIDSLTYLFKVHKGSLRYLANNYWKRASDEDFDNIAKYLKLGGTVVLLGLLNGILLSLLKDIKLFEVKVISMIKLTKIMPRDYWKKKRVSYSIKSFYKPIYRIFNKE